jgi:hypothetical protein
MQADIMAVASSGYAAASFCPTSGSNAALGARPVDRGADRRLDYEPEQTADCSHHSNLGLAPMLLGNQEHIEIRPHRAADIGEQEVDGIERKRIEPHSLG